ncbi:MAG: universal stress protein [Chitinophagaceae bacterium]
MKTLIVPVDFSSASVNAANYALDFAKAIDSSIILLYVCQVPIAFSEVPVAASTVQETFDDAEKELAVLKQNLLHRSDNKVKIYTELKEGFVVNQVAEYCRKINPYAVIMGASGSTAAERVIFGSNTIDALKSLSWPLIIVPKGARFNQVKNIGLASDLKNVIEAVHADEIKKMVKDLHATLHILHVYSNQDKIIGNPEIEGSEWIRDMFEELQPEFHFLNHDKIDVAIHSFAEKNNLDMLIVIPKKHGWLEGLFHNSDSKQVALHSHMPLLSVHQ